MRRPGPIVTRSFSASVASRPIPHSAPVPPPAAATSRPTAEFQTRHDVEPPRVDASAFRQGWKVATRLDSLLAAGRIDREAYNAACEWRRWAETVMPVRVQSWDVRVDASLVPNDAGALWRARAAGKLREAAQAIGPLRVRLLEAVVLHDLSWRAVAEKLRVSDKTVSAWTGEAISALSDWRAGRSVTPSPDLRYRHNGIGAG